MARLPFNLPSPLRRVFDFLRSKRLRLILTVAAVAGFLGAVYEAAFRAWLEPPSARVVTALYTRPSSWRDSAREARSVPIGSLRAEIAEYRIPVRLAAIPEPLIQAVLAVEDQRFYRHHGLDLRRIGGAALANLKSGGIRQGGSTITQQLAKNLFLTARRTPLRKLREAAMAAVLEDRYDKGTILEAYFNEIYLGQDDGDAIHGVGAAARYYFGKPARELSLGESALLAGMISAPNRYAPSKHPTMARRRRDLVLRLMVEQDRISRSAAARATREPVRGRTFPRLAVTAPHFRDFAVTSLGRAGVRPAERGGAIYTTLDAGLQRAANRAVAAGLDRLGAGVEAALVALDPGTGDILAMVGGRDYRGSQFNRATEARRQPGSAFKPMVALAALGRQDGDRPGFTLASVIADEPIRVTTPAGDWEPENYDRQYRGPVTFREALEQSLNIPLVRVGVAVGPERIVAAARKLGITSPLQPVPSLALGTSEVTPLELTRAYGTLAAAGWRAEPRVLLGVTERDGSGRVLGGRYGSRVADPAEVYLVTSALEGVVARGTGRALGDMGYWGGLAGKSGTSNDGRDAWFVAYTRDLVVGVWVGSDDGRSVGLTGARAALPIVGRFLKEALGSRGLEPFEMPEGVELARTSGGSADGWVGWECNGPTDVFLEGTAPPNRCGRFDGFRRWTRHLEGESEELRELIEEHGEALVRRLAEILAERGRRALR